MPLDNYSLIMGSAKGVKLDDDRSPHIEILLRANGEFYHAAVKVRSQIELHDLLYHRIDNYQSALASKLDSVDEGVINVRDDRPDLAIDYQEDNRFDKADMQIAPFKASGTDNHLRDFILPLVQDAIADDEIKVYVSGEMWGPDHAERDRYFRFTPSQGIHDVHMNQGSTGRFAPSNGKSQDGALFFRSPQGVWTAIYLALQSQVWTGQLPEDQHAGSVRVIAALINAANPESGRETGTLFDRSDSQVPLDGWKIKDKIGREKVLESISLPAGESLRVFLTEDTARLGNAGGEIILADNTGSIVDKVGY